MECFYQMLATQENEKHRKNGSYCNIITTDTASCNPRTKNTFVKRLTNILCYIVILHIILSRLHFHITIQQNYSRKHNHVVESTPLRHNLK